MVQYIRGPVRQNYLALQIWICPVNFVSVLFARFWVCKEIGKSCFVFRAIHGIQYNHMVCPEQVLAMTRVTHCLPHSATHPNHCFQNRQLAVHHIGIALIAVKLNHIKYSYFCIFISVILSIYVSDVVI